MWGFSSTFRQLGDLGFASIVMWGCIALYLATLAIDPGGIGMRGLSILSPSTKSAVIFGASGAIPVFGLDRWWTVLSAAWLHGNLLHIFFNLLWVRQLAPATAELYGASRSIIIYTVSSIVGFLLSSSAGLLFGASSIPFLRGAQFTLGASAPIFGLLGALVVYGRRTGSRHIKGQALNYAIILFIFGFVMPNIDNFAHLGGFVGGYAAARWMDPLQPERGDHVILAIACLVATALAIVASVVSSFTRGLV